MHVSMQIWWTPEVFQTNGYNFCIFLHIRVHDFPAEVQMAAASNKINLRAISLWVMPMARVGTWTWLAEPGH